MRKYSAISVFSAIMLSCSLGAVAQETKPYSSTDGRTQKIIERVFKLLPDITTYERFCIFVSQQPIEACIKAIPKTAFTSFKRQRSQARIDQLQSIADKGTEDTGFPLDDPWITWCVTTQSPECLDACLNGFVCSD